MLSRLHRLSRDDFTYVRKKGQTFRAHLVSFTYIPCREVESPGFSVVVPKKVIRSAVKRHIVKRRIYHIVRHVMPYMQCVEGIFFVQNVQNGFEACTYTALEKDITHVLETAGVIEKNRHS